MNIDMRDHKIDHNALLLLDELSKKQDITQRELSSKLGIALGLINSYLKTLVSKGYVTVSGIPRKRYTYYLTPRGLAEKARLTYQHLQNLTNLYRIARRDFTILFQGLKNRNAKRVAFCGVDEITEIAYLSLKEAGMELAGVVDREPRIKKFFGYNVLPISKVPSLDYDTMVITSFAEVETLKKALIEAGIDEKDISVPNTEGWLKRIEG